MAAIVLLAPVSAQAATITPNTFDDDNTNNGNCTLREAIIAANTDAADDNCTAGTGADEIPLSAGTYELSVPGAGEDAAATGDLDITDADGLKITGASGGSTVDANGIDGVFETLGTATADFDPLTITGGNRNDDGGGIHTDGTSTVNVTGVTLSGNTSAGGSYGGAISVEGGNASIVDTTMSGNTATADGGALDINDSATTVSVIGTTMSGNTADNGGGINLDAGDLNVTNTTVSGNQAAAADGDGGGVIVQANPGDAASFFNATIADNTAQDTGGGIFRGAGTDVANLKGTILANSAPTAPDCDAVTSQGNNLIQDTTGCTITDQQPTDITGQSPQLGPLTDNGGPTETQALQQGSPAIDAGPPDAPVTDQRGAPRNPDIGAYEFIACLGVAVNRIGGAQDDNLTGTPGPDAFLMLAGNDTASGLGGNDAFCPADGNDVMNGGDGNDITEGSAGNDSYDGGEGDDSGSGGDGNDTALGLAGNDTWSGDAGNDFANGGDGNDLLKGLDGKDKLKGANGKDKLKGGNGKDKLNGGKGKDKLNGGTGKDTCKGAAGKDKGKSCEKEKQIP